MSVAGGSFIMHPGQATHDHRTRAPRAETTTPSGIPVAALPAYRLFGLQIRSEIPLPLPQVSGVDGAFSDCLVQRAARNAVAVPTGQVLATKYRSDGSRQCIRYQDAGGDWLWNREIGTFHLSHDGQRVDVYPEAGIEDRLLSMMIMGQVAVFLLRQRGIPCLHASAVYTPAGTAAFLGQHGQGKSTMAACFLRRGAALLADDVLPLQLRREGTMAGPGLPIMKMWPETVSSGLAFSEPLPDIYEGLNKKLLMVGDRFPVLEEAAQLSVLYVLYRYDAEAAGRSELEIRPLSRMEAAAILLSQTSWNALLTPTEVAELLPVYARLTSLTAVRLLSYPNGFEHQDALQAGVMRDLEAL